MRKRNMSHSNYEHCCICQPIDEEVVSITDALLQRIQKAMEQVKRDSSQFQNSKLQPLDFTRLLKMIFNKRFKNLKATATCKHNDLKKAFITKLGCSSKDIDKVSSIISWKIAKFSFHTDIVILQSKSFLRHLIHSQNQKQRSKASENTKKVFTEKLKQEDQQNQQKSLEQGAMEKSINLSRLNLGEDNPEPTVDQYAYFWHFPWHTTPYLFANTEYMGTGVEKNSQMMTCDKIREQ